MIDQQPKLTEAVISSNTRSVIFKTLHLSMVASVEIAYVVRGCRQQPVSAGSPVQFRDHVAGGGKQRLDAGGWL